METTLHISAPELRAKLLVLLFEFSKPIYRATFKRNTKTWKTSKTDLEIFPEKSLGQDLFQFLNSRNFEIEAKLESHDIGHILLAYDTDVVSEICMQFFYLGSGKKSVYSFTTSLLGYLILPEYYKDFHQAFLRGRTAINFQAWDFEHLLKENTSTLQAQIFNKKTTNILYI